MKIIEFNKDDAKNALDTWRKEQTPQVLTPEYQEFRSIILESFRGIPSESEGDSRKDYLADVRVGIAIYKFSQEKSWFNLRLASNDNFWRYIATAVVPDVVAERWGINNDTYFWKQSNRLWPKTLWWYVHLTFQGDIDSTWSILTNKNFNSDIIQGLVERSGRKGTYVNVYREIIKRFGALDNNIIVRFKKERTKSSDSLFRAIMKLNTAKCLVIDPCLYDAGITGYVDSLFSDLIIK